MTFRIFLILFFLSCQNKEVEFVKKESKTIDLARILDKAKITGFKFDEKKDLNFHLKKNTARYSKLPEKRFINSQITFNTDKTIFQNESKDAILLSPNSSIEFDIEKDVYNLELCFGILSAKGEKAGRLAIEIDGILDEENSELVENHEKWNPFKKILRIDKKLKFIWNSNDSYLFLGHPILTPANQKKEFSNIILIVVDAMRYDSLSSNGSLLFTTPNLDEISKESILFTSHFVNANWTKPSMTSMFYSEYASNLGIGNTNFEVRPEQKKIFYTSPKKGLINFLREKKFYTASIMNNVFFLDYTGIGLDIGFHELIQIGKDIDDTEKITNSSLEFLDREFENPFFLHINYNTPHGPYTPPKIILSNLEKNSPKENLNKINPTIKRYLAEVNQVDFEIGKLIKKLKDKKLYDNTMLIITSDHGELFSDHHTALVNGVNGVKYGHGVTHYDEEIHVPLIIKPSSKQKEKIINQKLNFQTSHLSLAPTILGLSNINKRGFEYRGIDLSTNIFGLDNAKEKLIYTEGRLSESIRSEKFKYIRRYPFYTNSEISGRVLIGKELEEIYDIENDFDEKINLISDKELLKKYRNLLNENSLELNTFKIILPDKKSYYGKIFLSGDIYSAWSTSEVSTEIESKKTLSFKRDKFDKFSELTIKTVKFDSSFDITIYEDNKLVNYRVGKWGLVLKGNKENSEKLISVSERPIGIEKTNLPWIYNPSRINKNSYETANQIVGEEVRSILKSWGYIHE